ncbi:unnamed protein product [Rotaria sp. Silwood2]|nr:unnamed protein product [Rotaria sp. Silwood2]CAF2573028.1 unnamed protein product [Rotaria sp. Silwood2]CAF2734016.1 unnamed protein product [Rotaria sp. Silwood2]CAF2965904.1 unnamed protein product [Rotaria sp. Silwood2]CAF4056745.1 unnamed protein product [Rotaria sp. Silwood2]
MHSTSIFLLTFGLLITFTMAWPWSGQSHQNTENEVSQESNGHKWVKYRSPKYIRIPGRLAQKLGRPWPAFTAKKIFHGKYILISPALLFRIKNTDNTGTSTTSISGSSTTEQPEVQETTTESIGQGSTPEPEPEETTSESQFLPKKGSYSINNNEQLYFFDE